MIGPNLNTVVANANRRPLVLGGRRRVLILARDVNVRVVAVAAFELDHEVALRVHMLHDKARNLKFRHRRDARLAERERRDALGVGVRVGTALRLRRVLAERRVHLFASG